MELIADFDNNLKIKKLSKSDGCVLPIASNDNTVQDILRKLGAESKIETIKTAVNAKTPKQIDIFYNDQCYFIDILIQGSVQKFTINKYSRIKQFINSSYDGFWDWYIQDNYEYMSPRFWEMFGYKPDEKEHSPEAWQDMIFKEDLKIALSNFEKHVNTRGKHPYNQEVRYRHKDGSTVTVLCRGEVVQWSEDGKPLRMIGIHSDITEKKKFIEQLQHKKSELDEFVSVISHDLKEPLRSISLLSSFAKENIEEQNFDQLDKDFTRIQQLISHMTEMLDELRKYTQIDSQNPNHTKVSPNEILDKLIVFFTPLAKERNVSIKYSKMPEVNFQHIRLQEIFANLISNAIKYSKPNIGKVEIGHKIDQNNKVVFYVKDNGIGIEKNFYKNVFRIFRKANTKSSDLHSSGMGLSLVKKMLEHHGGSIWFESEENVGSTFFFTLTE